MKSKVFRTLILTGTLLCGIVLGGCTDNSVSADNGSYTYLGDVISESDCWVDEFKDNETGVHYFISFKGGIIPRYNTDGTLYFDWH